MTTTPIAGRTHYRSSGKVDWGQFITWSGLAIFTSAALAVLMCLMFEWGFYLVGLVPLMAGLGVAGTVMVAVHRGHCRSPLVGGLLGFFTGVLLYLGYYYASMVRDIGPDAAQHISILPQYIYLRLKTDVVRNAHDTTPERDNGKPHPERIYFNSALFALEFGFILVFTCGAGIRRARRSYCESCKKWMVREATTFLPEIGPAMVEALKIGSVQSLAALFTSPQKPAAPHTAVAVDCCPELKEGRTAECVMYMSVKQVSQTAKGATTDAFEGAKGKLLVRQVSLYTEESPALLSRFASLEKVAGTTASEALEKLQVAVKPKITLAVADVTPVEPEFTGKVLTKKVVLIGNAIMLGAIVMIFAAIGLGFLGGSIGFPDQTPAGGVTSLQKAAGVLLIAAAIAMFLGNIVWLLAAPDYFSVRYIRRVVDREFGKRPKPLVKPDDPEAFFVQIVPRANWAKLKLDDASDVGFMKVDQKSGEVLFEGDKERYRIPGAAIASCEIEIFISGEGTHAATKLFRVVLQSELASGFWEVPIAQRGGSGLFRTKKRERWAKDVQTKIRTVMSSATGA